MVSVCFLHVGPHHHYEPKFVASVRKAMPEARIVQFTDKTTDPLDVNEVVRDEITSPLWVHRWRSYSRLDGEVVCLDTDVIVQKDLSRVFALDFDVALTRRNQPILDPNGRDITKTMPFNGGVALSRNRGWLSFLADKCEELTTLEQDWYTDQLAMTVCARAGGAVLQLPCDLYNYTPRTQGEDVSHAWVVHYKGNRKQWM